MAVGKGLVGNEAQGSRLHNGGRVAVEIAAAHALLAGNRQGGEAAHGLPLGGGEGNGEDVVMQLALTIVHALGAVDHGALHDGGLAGGAQDTGIRVDEAGRQIKDHGDGGAVVVHPGVAVLQDVGLIQGELIAPGGDADGQLANARGGHGHPSVAGVSRFDGGGHAVSRHIRGGELVDVQGISLHTVDVVTEGGQQAVDVRGATGAAEAGHAAVGREAAGAPVGGKALRQVDLHGILIEELVTMQGEARENAVVKGALNDVGVLGLVVQSQHAVGKEAEGNARAGLGVGLIRGQIEGGGEGLADVGGAQTARDIHLAPCHVLPQGLAGLDEGFISGFGGQVSHARVEIRGADGVTHGGVLLPHGDVGLVVGDTIGVLLGAAGVDEVGGQIQELALARVAVHAHQGQLDLLVAGGTEGGGLILNEDLGDVVGVLFHALQQGRFARGLGVGDGGLHEVAGAVELVAVAVGPALLGLGYGEENIEVAVLPLIALDIVNDAIHLFLQGGIFGVLQDVGRALHPLGDVAVPEHVGLDGIPIGIAEGEGTDTPRFGKSVVHGSDGGLAVELLLIEEEAVFELYVTMGNEFHNQSSFLSM